MATKRKTKKRRGADDEVAFLKSYDPRAFEPVAVAVDVALIAVDDGALRTLVVSRDEHPFKGQWALPGAFVGVEESLEAAARRALASKVGLEGLFLEQLYTFGQPARDPRG